ncbi:hypothetical protein BMS3Abin03_02561 [bacterium BMS3Abin03]|nr:hypothetical protein BMS3Abin03_02561 [bacterium BMS3Abin03]
MIQEPLRKTNKEITRLKYDGKYSSKPDVEEMIDLLQYHIFLVHTCFDNPEFKTTDVKEKLLEKLEKKND